MFGAIELLPPGVSGAKKPFSSDIKPTLANSFVAEQYPLKTLYNDSAIFLKKHAKKLLQKHF
jgi:hypothetical protein